MEVLASITKGKPQAHYLGYVYRKHRQNSRRVMSWLCLNQKSLKCNGCLKTKNNNVISVSGHQCQPPEETNAKLSVDEENCMIDKSTPRAWRMPRRSMKGLAAFSHVQDIALCKMVGETPCLYDFTHPLYKDSIARENAWKSISDRLKKPENVCKSRWRNIRDSYKRGMRMKRAILGFRPSAEHMKWALYDHIQFLEKINRKNDLTPTTSATKTATSARTVSSSSSPVTSSARRRSQCVQSLKEVDVMDDEATLQPEMVEIKVELEDRNEAVYPDETAINDQAMLLYDQEQGREDDEEEGMGERDKEFSGGDMQPPFLVSGDSVSGSGEPSRKRRRMWASGHQSNVGNQVTGEQLTSARWYGGNASTKRASYDVTEDDTDVFFRSMSMTAKTFAPSLLAEAKKQICSLVMDLQVQNEKDKAAQAQHSLARASVDAVFSSTSSYRSSSQGSSSSEAGS